MEVILVPGLWLDASSWREVADRLAVAGHAPRALSLRGLSSRRCDRSALSLSDLVDEIVAEIERSAGPVALVGHAESCGLVHAAVDRRPDRVAKAVHVGGFPSADGTGVLTACRPIEGRRLLDDAILAELRERAEENGTSAVDAPQRLGDERRLDVPTVLVTTEFRAAEVRRWMDAGMDPARELRRLRRLTLIDLPCGRWPQIERGPQLAEVLLRLLPTPALQTAAC